MSAPIVDVAKLKRARDTILGKAKADEPEPVHRVGRRVEPGPDYVEPPQKGQRPAPPPAPEREPDLLDAEVSEPKGSAVLTAPIDAAMLAAYLGVELNAEGKGRAMCPAHRTENQSLDALSFFDGDTGLVVTCHSHKCSREAIAAALGVHESWFRKPGPGVRYFDRAHPYTDEGGALLFEVLRDRIPEPGPPDYKTKRIYCRRPTPEGGWEWKRGPRVLYRLDRLHAHADKITQGLGVWIAEGETCVEALEGFGLVATCNLGGAEKWTAPDTAQLVALGTKHVCILPDQDVTGERHARIVALLCTKAGIDARIVNLPEPTPALKGFDVADWIAAGGTKAELKRLALASPIFTRPAQPEPDAKSEAEPEPTPTTPAAARWSLSTPPESFVSRYVLAASERTDAPPEAHEAAALTLMSALAGSRVTIPLAVRVGGLPLVLWSMYVVNSTVGRKTTVLDFAADVFASVLDHSYLLQWETSPQALIESLMPHDGEPMLMLRDEFSGLLGDMNRLGGHQAALPAYLIRAYDVQPLENRRTAKKVKGSADRIEDTPRVARPYLPLLTATTRDGLLSHAFVRNFTDGFLARFAVVTGESTPRSYHRESPAMVKAWSQVKTAARDFRGRCEALRSVYPGDDVLAAHSALNEAWRALAGTSPNPEAASPTLQRLSDSVLKVAALLALDLTDATQTEEPDFPRITLEHFRMAEQIVARWRDSTLALIADVGGSVFQRDCEGVLGTVRAHGGSMRVRDLYRVHRRLKMRELNEVLDALEVQGRITQEKGEAASGPGARKVRTL